MQRHFASEDEIRSSTVTVDIDGAIRALNAGLGWETARGLCPAGGPIVRCNADGTAQVVNDDSHSVMFASTGRGKTRRFVYPTLFADICSGTNLVVNDMKGEIYATTRGLLELAGYTVYVLDLRDTRHSPNRYNPLDIAWSEWNMGRQDSAYLYLRNFALSMFDVLSQTTNDAFWPNTAVDYFMGLSLGMLEAGVTREEFTLESVAVMDRVGNERERSTTKLKRFFDRFPPDSIAAQNVSGTINAPNDTKASILSVFRSPMALYAGQRDLMDTLSRSDFDAHELTQPRRALFVISPDETHAFGPVVVGVLNQMMSAMISLAQREYGGVLPNRVDFILDEMGNLPARIPDMEALVSASRSRNMRFHLVLQSAAQLANVYGNELRDVILDNCDTLVYMGSRGLDFLKRISELAGEVQLESGRVRPLLSVEKLQHLEKRDTETETLVFLSSLKPYVTPLKDVEQYVQPVEPATEPRAKEPIERKVFDLESTNASDGEGDGGDVDSILPPWLRGSVSRPEPAPAPAPITETPAAESPFATSMPLDIDQLMREIDAKIAELEAQEAAPQEDDAAGRFLFHIADDEHAIVTSWETDDEEVDVPPTVNGHPITELGKHAFFKNGKLRAVTLPEGLTIIGEGACADCASLSSVTLPSTLERIGSSAFNHCTSLVGIKLPQGLERVYDWAFSGCTSLESIDLPDSLAYDGHTGVYRYAFSNCTSLSSVILPSGLRYLEDGLFENCTSLTFIKLPNRLEGVGASAFNGCTSLKMIALPHGIGTIGDRAFQGCAALTSMALPSDLKLVGRWAYKDCTSLESVTFPDELETIRTCAFQGCTSLKSVTLPRQLIRLEADAFESWTEVQ